MVYALARLAIRRASFATSDCCPLGHRHRTLCPPSKPRARSTAVEVPQCVYMHMCVFMCVFMVNTQVLAWGVTSHHRVHLADVLREHGVRDARGRRAVADDGDVKGGACVRASVGAPSVLHVGRVDCHISGPNEHADRQRATAASRAYIRRRGGRKVGAREHLQGPHLGLDPHERELQLECLRLARALRGRRGVRVEGLGRVRVRVQTRA